MHANGRLLPYLSLFWLVYLPAELILPELLSRLGLGVTGPGHLVALLAASHVAAARFVDERLRVPGPLELRRFALLGTLLAVAVTAALVLSRLVLEGVAGEALSYLGLLVTESGPWRSTAVILLLLFSTAWLVWLSFRGSAARRHAVLVRRGVIRMT